MLDQITAGFKAHFPDKLVDELLSAYQDAKHNFFLGGLRLSAVEGGRFCEAAMRMLEHATTNKFTDLGRMVASDKLFETLSNYPKAQFPESIRVHIPRAIRVVYDIRNKRDAAHLADDIDPNLQDATLVVSALDWVLAEFIRLYHGVSADEATRIIEAIVTRRVPVIEDFDGFLKVLNPKLRVSGYVLVLLYERGTAGATFAELEKWVRPTMRSNLRRTLSGMVDDALLHENELGQFFLTKLGRQEVEKRNLHSVA
ncbi:hypothetical protein [Bradyrhizobium ganzhouense]|uniref:hypothetical protein n=1 Tax=Bradyrhizobium ganzhouense TaxID=1179767 RepID=UPI003CF6EF96